MLNKAGPIFCQSHCCTLPLSANVCSTRSLYFPNCTAVQSTVPFWLSMTSAMRCDVCTLLSVLRYLITTSMHPIPHLPRSDQMIPAAQCCELAVVCDAVVCDAVCCHSSHCCVLCCRAVEVLCALFQHSRNVSDFIFHFVSSAKHSEAKREGVLET